MAPVVLVSKDHPAGRHATRVLRELAARFLGEVGRKEAELSVVVTTDARIRGLNRRWRGKDRATDVLSFPAGDAPRAPGRPVPLGDVVVSLDTARRRARGERRPLREELARYLAHGLLHLLGHDHDEPDAARRMAAAEARLLGGAGMVADARLAATGKAR